MPAPLNIEALAHALRGMRGFGPNKVLKKDSAQGPVTWQSLVAADLPSTITGVNYLVGTASSDLSAEIVVGTTPGGELGGTWASPTVDATHSGSAHHAQSHGASDHTDRTRYLYLGAELAMIQSGTPDLAVRGSNAVYGAWAMDSAASEGIMFQVAPLADYAGGAVSVDLHWTNLGAGAGNCVIRAVINPTASGGDYNAVGSIVLGTSHTVAAPAQGIRQVSPLTITFTPTAGNSFSLILQRLGADGNDTLANDAGFVAVTLSYTADG